MELLYERGAQDCNDDVFLLFLLTVHKRVSDILKDDQRLGIRGGDHECLAVKLLKHHSQITRVFLARLF